MTNACRLVPQRARRSHRVLGLVMALPLVAWAATGILFFLKPGWSEAYAPLALRTMPLTDVDFDGLRPRISGDWREARVVRSALGPSLLVRDESSWQHLDPTTGAPRPLPSTDEATALFGEAISTDPLRYGTVSSITLEPPSTVRATTTTDVDLLLDWQRLSLSQSGPDTRRIDLLYRIHYLQWTGIAGLDRALGLAGIAGIALLVTLGLWLRRS